MEMHKTNRKRLGLLLKITGIFSMLLIAAIMILSFFSIRSTQSSSMEIAMIMGRSKLHGDITSFQDMLELQYGQLRLVNGELVDEQNNSLKYDYSLVDNMYTRLGVQVTIFVRDNDDFRRITTSVVDVYENRAVDTFLGSESAAYNPLMSGNDFIGIAAILGNDYLSIYRPIFADNSREVIGVLFLGIEMGYIENFVIERRTKNMIPIIIASLIILFIALVITIIFARRIVKPIIEITNAFKDIAEGDADLTQSVSSKSNDETGELVRYFNQILMEIKKMVINIKNEAFILLDIGSDLSSNMNETAAAVNEITANIQSIKTRVLNQSASVSETHATMEQVVVNINKLNGHVGNQSSNVAQASSAIEQMVANTRSVIDTLIKNTENVRTLQESSEIGRAGLSEVAADINEIARESEGLMEINSVMENIASQTNLLSMNAAIEAAHAGEAGKGFAVVADEIRKLAESSSEQSKTIGSVLKKIKGAIDKITISTENVLTKFEAIDSSIKTVADQEENIRNAMEEQGVGSKQILEGISNVNEITRQVQSGSNEMLEGSNEVIRESTNLEKVTQEITSGMNEMASGAEQINVAVNHVNEISKKNREGIDTLIKEVSRFKVD